MRQAGKHRSAPGKNRNGLEPKSDGLQPKSDGLQPLSDGLRPSALKELYININVFLFWLFHTAVSYWANCFAGCHEKQPTQL